jgi:hypothetical protein
MPLPSKVKKYSFLKKAWDRRHLKKMMGGNLNFANLVFLCLF